MQGMPQMPQFQVPLVGQEQKQAKQHILAAVEQLSLGIYSHLATSHIATRDQGIDQPIDAEHLQQLARDSHAAGQAYFVGRGLASFGGDK